MPSPAGTVAVIAAISSVVQCVIWLALYVVYVIAYECQFQPSKGKTITASQNLGYSILLYVEADKCLTESEKGNFKKNGRYSQETLLTVVSIAAALNAILFIVSITLLSGFWQHPVMKKKRLLAYIIMVFLTSITDLIVTGMVASDYEHLKNNSMEDALVTFFMVSCRGGFILATNVAFIFYLTLNYSKSTYRKPSPRPYEPQRIGPSPVQNQQAKPTNFGNDLGPTWNTVVYDESKNGRVKMVKDKPPEHTAAARWPGINSPQPRNEEVSARWTEYPKREDEASPTSDNTSSGENWEDNQTWEDFRPQSQVINLTDPSSWHEERRDYQRNWSQGGINRDSRMERREEIRNDWNQHEDKQGKREEHKYVEDKKHVWNGRGDSPRTSVTPTRFEDRSRGSSRRDRRDEDRTTSPIGHSSRMTGRESSGTPSLNETREPQGRPVSRQSSKKIPPDAFSYGYGKMFFGEVKLRPVKRDDIPVRSTDNFREISPESSNSMQSSEEARYSDGSGIQVHPTPPPPPDDLHNVHPSLTRPMSLQEAILTRRPLKPVSRPAINTKD